MLLELEKKENSDGYFGRHVAVLISQPVRASPRLADWSSESFTKEYW